MATRKAYVDALVALRARDPLMVALDGEISNSTYAEAFAHASPDRCFEMFIAEQQLVAVVDQTMQPTTASLWLRPGSLPCSGWPVSQDDGSRGVPTEAGRADTRPPRRHPRQ